MATPILTVPVDDAAFKRFLDTFKKYQATLKEQPEMWKSMAGGVDGVAVAAAVMTEEIIRQTEETKKLTTEEEKREKVAQDAARRRKKDDDEQDRREKKAHDARKKQIDQVREYGRTVSNTVSSFGKWAAGGGSSMGIVSGVSEAALGMGALGAVGAGIGGLIAALAAGGGATYFADKIVADRRRTALGLGTTPGKIQGYEKALQYSFDVDSAFSKMAEMQNDPTALSTFGMMGINSKGRDTADLVKESAIAARRMWIADQKNPMLAKAHGYGNIYSIPDLNTMAAGSEKELRDNFAKGDAFAKNHGQSDDMGTAAQKAVVQIDLLASKLQNGLIYQLTTLNPILTKLVNEANGLADALSMFDQTKAQPAGLITGGKYKNAWDYLGDAVGGGTGAWIKKNMGAEGGTGGGGTSAAGASGSSIFPKYTGFNPWANSGAGIQAGNGSLADQNNNPGNIRGRNGSFIKFATPEAGWAAMRHQLLIDYDRYGQHSIRSIINSPTHGWSNEWAKGNTHESTANYISSVARQFGVGADDELDLHDTKMLQRLAQAMNHVERGTGSGGRKKAAHHRSQVHVKVSNQTGSSVATTVHSAAG